MPGSPLPFLSVGFPEHNPDVIKGRGEEGNCCSTDDVLEERQYVTAALMSFADLKYMPLWAVLIGSGREPVHRNIGTSFSTETLGQQSDMAVTCHREYFRFPFSLGKVNPKPPDILESDLAAIFSFEVIILFILQV